MMYAEVSCIELVWKIHIQLGEIRKLVAGSCMPFKEGVSCIYDPILLNYGRSNINKCSGCKSNQPKRLYFQNASSFAPWGDLPCIYMGYDTVIRHVLLQFLLKYIF